MNVQNIKVSGAGWLCVKKPDGSWLSVFQLTPEQIHEYNEVENLFRRIEKAGTSVDHKPR